MNLNDQTGFIVAIGSPRGSVFTGFVEELGMERCLRDLVQSYYPRKVWINAVVEATSYEYQAIKEKWIAEGLRLRSNENWYSSKAADQLRRLELIQVYGVPRELGDAVKLTETAAERKARLKATAAEKAKMMGRPAPQPKPTAKTKAKAKKAAPRRKR